MSAHPFKINHWHGFRIPWFKFRWIDGLGRPWKDTYYIFWAYGRLNFGPYPHTEN